MVEGVMTRAEHGCDHFLTVLKSVDLRVSGPMV